MSTCARPGGAFLGLPPPDSAAFLAPLEAKPYGYFPGMGSTVVLAPLAWRGMYRLWLARLS